MTGIETKRIIFGWRIGPPVWEKDRYSRQTEKQRGGGCLIGLALSPVIAICDSFAIFAFEYPRDFESESPRLLSYSPLSASFGAPYGLARKTLIAKLCGPFDVDSERIEELQKGTSIDWLRKYRWVTIDAINFQLRRVSRVSSIHRIFTVRIVFLRLKLQRWTIFPEFSYRTTKLKVTVPVDF